MKQEVSFSRDAQHDSGVRGFYSALHSFPILALKSCLLLEKVFLCELGMLQALHRINSGMHKYQKIWLKTSSVQSHPAHPASHRAWVVQASSRGNIYLIFTINLFHAAKWYMPPFNKERVLDYLSFCHSRQLGIQQRALIPQCLKSPLEVFPLYPEEGNKIPAIT